MAPPTVKVPPVPVVVPLPTVNTTGMFTVVPPYPVCGVMVRDPLYTPTPAVSLALAVTVTAVVPSPEIVSEVDATDNQVPLGETLGVKIYPAPVRAWRVTVCDVSPLLAVESAMLLGVTLIKPLLVDPVFPPQLVFSE